MVEKMADRTPQTPGSHTNSTFSDSQPLPASVERRIALARALLFWQSLWPALWPALSLTAVFLILALTGLIQTLPSLIHLVASVSTGAGIIWLGWSKTKSLRWPSRAQGLHWLEQASNLPHRPLSALEDTRSAGDQTLWAAHRARAARALSRLRLGPPPSKLDRRDPLFLRVGLLLGLIIALIGTPQGRWTRIGTALWPAGFTATAGHLEAWVTPPAYTGHPPLFLDRGRPDRLTLPTGSVLSLRVDGGRSPRLSVDGTDTDGRFTKTATGHELDHELVTGGPIAVNQSGRTLGQWQTVLLPDTPPEITWAEPLTASLSRSLKFAYRVEDDYGVAQAEARLVIDEDTLHAAQTLFDALGVPHEQTTSDAEKGVRPPLAPPAFALPLPKITPRKAEAETFQDLTAHPWAGLPVTITLLARDEAGQEGRSKPANVILPERPFEKPLAAAIIEQRRRLALSSSSIASVAGFLNAFSFDAERYIDDKIVYLALRAAYWRLDGARTDAELAGIFDLLWDTALRIEDGDISLAERELRAARDALRDALAKGADEEEIERLMDQLKQALSNYMDALSQQAENDPNAQDDMPADPFGQAETIDRQDLEDMLDAIADLARTGARDQAQELLSQLDNILENMQTGTSPSEMTPDQAALADALDEMSGLIEKQRGLMDETFQEGQEGRQGQAGQQGENQQAENQQAENQQGQGSQQGHGQQGDAGQARAPGADREAALKALGKQQQTLRDQLADMMDKLGDQGADVPSALDRAGRAMSEAERRLDNDRPDSAAAAQGKALDELRQGAQAMADRLMESMGAGQGQTARGNGTAGKDPLGRPLRGAGSQGGEDVAVPDEFDLQRAREILHELRRRAAELGRPDVELDYLDRLLKRF